VSLEVVVYIVAALFVGGLIGAGTMSLLAMAGKHGDCERCIFYHTPGYSIHTSVDFSSADDATPKHVTDDELPY